MAQIADETVKQGTKIAVSIDAIGCNLYRLPSDLIHPDRMFTPGGVDLIDAVERYIEKKYDLQTGRLFANILLKSIGSVIPLNPEITTTFDSVQLSSIEVREAIALLIRIMLQNIVEDISLIVSKLRTSNEDLSDTIIILRGEFSYLRGLDRWIEEATGLKVIVE